MLRADGKVYFYLFLLITRCVTLYTHDKRCVKEGKTGEEKDNCSDPGFTQTSWKIFGKDWRDSISILDLSEAQERDKSKRQTMFVSIFSCSSSMLAHAQTFDRCFGGEMLLYICPRVCSFGNIWIRISDPRSLGSWCIKGTDESVIRVDSPVPLKHHGPSDLGSLIRIRITPKERTLSVRPFAEHVT